MEQAAKDAKCQRATSVLNDLEIEAARAWFARGGVSFRTVCDLAGVDPEYIQRKSAQRLPMPKAS